MFEAAVNVMEYNKNIFYICFALCLVVTGSFLLSSPPPKFPIKSILVSSWRSGLNNYILNRIIDFFHQNKET